jgi:CDP-diacylglycerol--glycerol-3-phosphate 3-phosphatidyltransferase
MFMNLALFLTWMRLVAIPVVVLVYFLPFASAHVIATIFFFFACVTDYFDGYVARTRKQATKLGAFLDPVADKLLVTCALITVLSRGYSAWLFLPVTVIICREITISALREWMAELGKRASIAVSALGKLKTTLQMCAIGVLLFVHPGLSVWYLRTGILMLNVAAALTLWSMIIYIKIAMPDLTLAGKQ